MTLATALSLGETALKLGLICSLTVLALFLSYSMLNVCDLSTDGCFTLGAAVGAAVAVSGHPFLSIIAAMLAGICSGFVTGFFQTKMGVDSLLAGIIVNTGLYSINIAVMGGSSLINMNRTDTVFSMMKDVLADTPLKGRADILVALIAVAAVIAFLVVFLKTRLGLAIRATGNNADMVKSSSIPYLQQSWDFVSPTPLPHCPDACFPSHRNLWISTSVREWLPSHWLPFSSAVPSWEKAGSL